MSSKQRSLRYDYDNKVYLEGKPRIVSGSADYSKNKILFLMTLWLLGGIFVIILILTKNIKGTYNIMKIVFDITGGIGGTYFILDAVKAYLNN